jgi:hypothetical protein
MKTFSAMLFLLFLLTGCSMEKTTNELTTDPLMLVGHSFVLQVDRAVKAPFMKGPLVELAETDYTVSVSGKSYSVTFSSDGMLVTLEPGSILGEKGQTATGTLGFYNLTGGVFAGGRVVIRKVQEKLEGELTIYGSGVPIVLSERGSLVAGK